MKILSITSRTVTIELNNRTIYYAKEVRSEERRVGKECYS